MKKLFLQYWKKGLVFFILVIVVFFIVPFIINECYNDTGYMTQWSVEDYLLYCASGLGVIGSMFLGWIAIYQNKKLRDDNNERERRQLIDNREREIRLCEDNREREIRLREDNKIHEDALNDNNRILRNYEVVKLYSFVHGQLIDVIENVNKDEIEENGKSLVLLDMGNLPPEIVCLKCKLKNVSNYAVIAISAEFTFMNRSSLIIYSSARFAESQLYISQNEIIDFDIYIPKLCDDGSILLVIDFINIFNYSSGSIIDYDLKDKSFTYSIQKIIDIEEKVV